jgi:hypothetical protein
MLSHRWLIYLYLSTVIRDRGTQSQVMTRFANIWSEAQRIEQCIQTLDQLTYAALTIPKRSRIVNGDI